MTTMNRKAQKPKSPPRKNSVMKRLATTLSQDELVGALHSSADERIHRLAEMMTDPAYSRFTLGKLCERVGLSSIDLLNAFRKYKIDMGIVEMSRRAPTIMEDIALDAESKMVCCDHCGGTGRITAREAELDCPLCEGVGQTRTPGDDKSRRLFFKIMSNR